MPDILMIEPCDFERFPIGGQLSFAKQMMTTFGNRLALVGISTDDTPTGRWIIKQFDGQQYSFLAVARRVASGARPLVPARITAYLDIRKCKRQILASGIRSAFTQSPETLMAIEKWGWDSLCYRSPGHANPLKMARYTWARPFAPLYDAKFFAALKSADVVLASADNRAIAALAQRSRGLLSVDRIIQFPTRVDMCAFRPMPRQQARQAVGLDGPGPVIVTCGRINKVKGWDLLIQAFAVFRYMHREAQLVFVGDGEDRALLQQAIREQGLVGSVLIGGFQPPASVVQYLNAADVVVVGSYKEGWSVAMIEALACGRAVVATDVSGARDLIVDGQNGFVVADRDPGLFAAAMARAVKMKIPNDVSLSIAEKYSLANLRNDLGRLWKPLARSVAVASSRSTG
jgi:glycosyltransferase involved in cell wall biosynthesis